MGWFRVVSILLSGFTFLSCGNGVTERPVSLPIPFAGALTADSRVVVSSGTSVETNFSVFSGNKNQTQSSCSQFQNFNFNGSLAGNSEFCESGAVISTPFVNGRRDS